MTDGPALRSRRQHRLPGLRAVPAPDASATTSATAWSSARSRRPSARAGRRGAPDGPPGGLREAQAGQLSGGQRQRVALARALVNRPRVLLLDEPLGALDLKLREEMQIELKAIQQEVGITFIYVTHDQEEALTMSDRMAVFNARPDRADRRPGRGLRTARDPVRGRLRRDLQPARGEVARRSSAGRDVHDPPEKIRLAEPEDPPAPAEIAGDRASSAMSCTSARTRAISSPSTRGPSSSSPSRTCATTSTEALAQQGKAVRLPGSDSINSPSRTGRDRRRRRPPRLRGIMSIAAVAAIVVGACSRWKRQPVSIDGSQRRRAIGRTQRTAPQPAPVLPRTLRQSGGPTGQHASDARTG